MQPDWEEAVSVGTYATTITNPSTISTTTQLPFSSTSLSSSTSLMSSTSQLPYPSQTLLSITQSQATISTPSFSVKQNYIENHSTSSESQTISTSTYSSSSTSSSRVVPITVQTVETDIAATTTLRTNVDKQRKVIAFPCIMYYIKSS